MESYKYLLDIALILISTKILGLLTRRIQLPQVVGALIAGLLLGPACFGVLQETDFIKNIAEIGVIVLMFAAGLETDVQELKKAGFDKAFSAILDSNITTIISCVVLYISGIGAVTGFATTLGIRMTTKYRLHR